MIILYTRKWFWTIVFVLGCSIILERSVKHVNDEYQILKKQMDQLQESKSLALLKQEDLKKRINSQSDPAWIELVLKRELGLVPEGHTKVLFTN